MRHLRQEAVRRSTKMSVLVEAGLRLDLADPNAAGRETVDFRNVTGLAS